MRVPVKLEIAGRPIIIRYKKSLPDDDGSQLSGQCYPFEQPTVIEINTTKNASAEAVMQTLVHEMVHCGLPIFGLTEGMSGPKEEQFAYALELIFGSIFSFRPKAKGVRWREVKFAFESGREETDDGE